MNTETDGATPQGETPGETSDGVQYAGFWLRLAAYLLDLVILTVIFMVLALVHIFFSILVLGLTADEAFLGIDGSGYVVPTVVQIFVPLVYFAGFNSSRMEGTPGKVMLGLKITDATGNRISIPRALGRQLAILVSTLMLCIGYIMIAFTNRKRGLHDMMAGTLVVKR